MSDLYLRRQDDRAYNVNVVGESHYVAGLLHALGLKRSDTGSAETELNLVLFAEPGNPYDSNAVQVQMHDDTPLGYIARDDAVVLARHVHPACAAGHRVFCRGRIGGSKKQGVWVIGVQLSIADDLFD